MDLGSYVEYDGRPAVRFVRTYPAPVERVWPAISEPAGLAHWFPSQVEIDLRIGGVVRFSGDPNAGDGTGTVIACDPPHRLAFTWGEDELHFDLEPVEGGRCRLTLVNVLADREAAARNAAGWSVCLAELDKQIQGVPSDGPHSDAAEPFQPIYDAHVAAGLPHGAEIPSPQA
jgi:uncharacterized protein YndB with AHSA1/START domain